ncbi:hypothetical protein O7632_23010 [Solwaraspora sp. WMMD406]|uniref:hypothetical protein n=1 Tax=Solwaraspora sp. WMMD406 TaxID=3016095 RepID=UPI002415FA1E|nr:hypothetical protein [Solwaraspora sp. WMMD406]MDG4766945.1 hypothetical protein [Solwaraspora sp. WMMD406]
MVVTVGRFAARAVLGLAGAAGLLVTTAGPVLAQPGYRLEIAEVPDEALAGGGPVPFTVVVSRDFGGDCEKVRWSLVLRTEGLGLEQVRAARIEQGQAFAIDVRTDGDSARLTDVRLDPGTLCGDRTVTAEYQFSFAEDTAGGKVTFTAEAYTVDLRLLADTGVTVPVVAESGAADATPSPSAEATEEPGIEPPAGGSATGGSADDGIGGGAGQPVDAIPAGDASGIPVAWFVAGGAMVFVGFGLLLRVRARLLRATADPDSPLPVASQPRLTGQPRLTCWPMPTRSPVRGVGRAADGWNRVDTAAYDDQLSAAFDDQLSGSRSGRSRWR